MPRVKAKKPTHKRPVNDPWSKMRGLKLTPKQVADRAEYDVACKTHALAGGPKYEQNLYSNLKQVEEVESFFGRKLTKMELRVLTAAMAGEVTFGALITGKVRRAIDVAKEIFTDEMLESTGLRNGEVARD